MKFRAFCFIPRSNGPNSGDVFPACLSDFFAPAIFRPKKPLEMTCSVISSDCSASAKEDPGFVEFNYLVVDYPA